MLSFCLFCYALGAVILYKVLDRLIRRFFLGSYESRYILITGCDTGFGNLIAKRLDKLGCHVFAACLTQEGINELRKECSQNLVPLRLNVSDPDSVRKACELVKSTLPEGKGLWGVLNNAAILGACGPHELLTLEDYKSVNGINLYGLIDVTVTFLPLVKMEKGRVVNTASIFGRHCVGVATPYSISKYGVEAFTDGLRRGMRAFGVKAILIEPGLHKTNISSLRNSKSEADRIWNKAPQSLKDEYGEAFYVHLTTAGLGKFEELCSNRLTDVIDAYEHALLGRFPRARYVVGFDANYLWWPLQMLPEWLGDYLLSKAVPGQPLPAAVEARNKKTN